MAATSTFTPNLMDENTKCLLWFLLNCMACSCKQTLHTTAVEHFYSNYPNRTATQNTLHSCMLYLKLKQTSLLKIKGIDKKVLKQKMMVLLAA